MSTLTSFDDSWSLSNERRGHLISLAYDAHCHYHLDESSEAVAERSDLLNELGGATLMAMGEQDWDQVRSVSQKDSLAHYALGVHPWLAHHYMGRRDWLASLEDRLRSDSRAVVGEIGLDRKWRAPETDVVEYQAQRDVFLAQLKLAGELGRPVSVHCVKAQGDLYKALDQCAELPPAIYFHAFGGAVGTAEQLLRSKRFGDRLYFGFAACVNLRSPKTRAVIQSIPHDRLLLESDRSSPSEVKRELIKMLMTYREAKSWESLEEVARQTSQNAETFYRSR